MEGELRKILELLEAEIDLEHCQSVQERYAATMAWESTAPPLVVQAPFGEVFRLPPPWNRFRRYSYKEAFSNPAAMMQNMLLDRVVPGVLLRDDNPLAIRNDHGTIQVASVIGGSWKMFRDDYPWVGPLKSAKEIEKLLEDGLPERLTERGVVSKSLRTLEFYNEILEEYPVCRKAIQISLPDLQGPLDTAEQLWGSGIYLAFYDGEELMNRLLMMAAQVMLKLEAIYRPYTTDNRGGECVTQHGYMVPGRLLIRDDSAINISSGQYREFIRPYDAFVLERVSGGSIHFCGDGGHLVDAMLDIPGLRGLDFGQPWKLDIGEVYRKCREHKKVLTNLMPARETLVNGKAREEFPEGCVFVYHTCDHQDAAEVVKRYREN